MLHNLPDELWLDIFDMAVDDADFFEPTLPTPFSEASWFKTLYGDWAIRTAQEVVNNAQRQSCATKKVRTFELDKVELPTKICTGDHEHLQELAAIGLRVLLPLPLHQQSLQHPARLRPYGHHQGSGQVDEAFARHPLHGRSRLGRGNYPELPRGHYPSLPQA